MTPILEIQNLSHIYSPDTPFEHPALTHVDWDAESAERCGYPDFMLKEIYDQPQ